MPSVSKKQHNFMEMIAHNPGAARRVGVPQSVGQDFADADEGNPLYKRPSDPAKPKRHPLFKKRDSDGDGV